MAILANLTQEEILAKYNALLAENAKLKANKGSSIKVSEKGAVSVYGMGRFPVTLYGSQWRKLIEMIPAIEQFMLDNADKLSEKPEKSAD